MKKEDVCITFGEKSKPAVESLTYVWGIYGGKAPWFALYPNKFFATKEEAIKFLDSDEWKQSRWYKNLPEGFEIYLGTATRSYHRKVSRSTDLAWEIEHGNLFKYEIK